MRSSRFIIILMAIATLSKANSLRTLHTTTQSTLDDILVYIRKEFPDVAKRLEEIGYVEMFRDSGYTKECPIAHKIFKRKEYFYLYVLKSAATYESTFSFSLPLYTSVHNFIAEFDYLLELSLPSQAGALCTSFLSSFLSASSDSMPLTSLSSLCTSLSQYPYKITNRNAIGYFVRRVPIVLVVIVGLLVVLFRVFEVLERSTDGR